MRSVTIRGAKQAVDAAQFEGQFSARDLRVLDDDAGIVASASGGPQYDSWRVVDSRFDGNAGPAIDVGAQSSWTVDRTAFLGSGTFVDATAANATVDLRGNWWGADGFDAAQVEADALTGGALAAPPGEGTDATNGSPYAVEPGPGSKATWEQDLPEVGEGASAVWVATAPSRAVPHRR